MGRIRMAAAAVALGGAAAAVWVGTAATASPVRTTTTGQPVAALAPVVAPAAPPATTTTTSRPRLAPTTTTTAPANPTYNGQPCTGCTRPDSRHGPGNRTVGVPAGPTGTHNGTPIPPAAVDLTVTVTDGAGHCRQAGQMEAAEQGLKVIPAAQCTAGTYTPPVADPTVIVLTKQTDPATGQEYDLCYFFSESIHPEVFVGSNPGVAQVVAVCPAGINAQLWSSPYNTATIPSGVPQGNPTPVGPPHPPATTTTTAPPATTTTTPVTDTPPA